MLDGQRFVVQKDLCNRESSWRLKCMSHQALPAGVLVRSCSGRPPASVKHSMVWKPSHLQMAPDPFRGALTITLQKVAVNAAVSGLSTHSQ